MNASRYTQPLSTNFTSAIDKWIDAIQLIWKRAFGYELEEWQVDLLRRLTETYSDGPKAGVLRYRQVLVSLGRQNGKTELAAALGLWQFLMKLDALVIGIASNREQADIVYDRTMKAISRNPALAKRFAALTTTRGLRTVMGGRYEIKASKSASLQGLPIDLGIVDEVHLLKIELWTALLNGAGGRDNALVVGITTAGDEDSELLNHLYELGDLAVAGMDDRFGFFVWEAPAAEVPKDDETLAEYLKAANPSIASGRIDVDNIINDVRSMPDTDAIRYKLNRNVSADTFFVSPSMWATCSSADFPAGKFVVAIDQYDYTYASVVVAIRTDDGQVHTRLVASLVRPTHDQLMGYALQLHKRGAALFVMDGRKLKNLAEDLAKRGLRVQIAGYSDLIEASAMLYTMLATQKLKHDKSPELVEQINKTIRKKARDTWVIAPKGNSAIDGIRATTLAMYFADTYKAPSVQVFA